MLFPLHDNFCSIVLHKQLLLLFICYKTDIIMTIQM